MRVDQKDMKIVSRKQFDDILLQNGWTQGINSRFLICPFDNTIRVCRSNGTFFTGQYGGIDYVVIAKITNIRRVSWQYDNVTGLISNNLVALRIK